MPEKVFEISEKYEQVAENLVNFIKKRDEAIEAMKYMKPPDRIKAQNAIDDLNKGIEECEAWMAKEYEFHQAEQHNQALINESIETGMNAAINIFIELKNNRPEKLEEFKATVFRDFPEEEIQDFYDRVAIREATHLDDIIAEKEQEKL